MPDNELQLTRGDVVVCLGRLVGVPPRLVLAAARALF